MKTINRTCTTCKYESPYTKGKFHNCFPCWGFISDNGSNWKPIKIENK